MDRLKGGEVSRLEELEHRRDKLAGHLQEAKRRLAEEQEKLKETGLSDDPPQTADLDARRQDLQDAREHLTRLENQQYLLEEAQAAEAEAAETLRPTDGRSPKIAPDVVDQAVRMA
jgi:hypothetical protein